MLGGGDPVEDHFFELLRRHTGVRGHDELDQRLFTAGQGRFEVAFENGGEGLLILPLGVLRREGLHAVQREEELEIHRLLGPERAVVVEGGDAFRGGNKFSAAFLGDFFHKGDDGFFRRGVIPRRQGVGRGGRSREREKQEGEAAQASGEKLLFHRSGWLVLGGVGKGYRGARRTG